MEEEKKCKCCECDKLKEENKILKEKLCNIRKEHWKVFTGKQ